jgi:hypothetical protein
MSSQQRIALIEFVKEHAINDETINTIEDFMDKYYQPGRYKLSPMIKDYPNYAQLLLAGNKEHAELFGFCTISKFESITGRTVTFITDTNNNGETR